MRIVRNSAFEDVVVGDPPRTRLEVTLLDWAALARPDTAIAILSRAAQQRRTTASRLLDELDRRGRHPHGSLLRQCLQLVHSGAESPAEVRFIRDVERAHGLPVGLRQACSVAGRHDNEYPDYHVIVEIDGRLGHETWSDRVRDGLRDRIVAASGHRTIRVFWPDVALTPCATALQLAAVLRVNGWTGEPGPCRRGDCALRR